MNQLKVGFIPVLSAQTVALPLSAMLVLRIFTIQFMKFTIAGIEIELFFQAWSFLSFFSGVYVVPYSLTRAGGIFFKSFGKIFKKKKKRREERERIKRKKRK